MIIQMLKRKVVADKTVAHVCQILCSIVGAIVLVLGFRRLEQMDLTEAQLYSATIETLLLAAAFIALALIFHVWRSRS